MSEPSESQPPSARRRGVLGMSGWLLFVCLFLPTLRVCGDPVAPIQFPPTYGVYLGGLVVAIIGWSVVRRRRQQAFVILQGLYVATLFMIGALWIGSESEPAGFLAAALFIFLTGLIVRRTIAVPWSERAIAIGCLIHGLVSLAWSSLLVFDANGLWGATVSLGASSLMLFAAGGYLASEVKEERQRRSPPPLPEARLR